MRQDFAIALRGPITRNTAMIESSDIDLFVIMHRSVKPLDAYDLPLPQSIKPNVSQTTFQRLLAHPEWAWWRFSVAFSGWVLFGPDCIKSLPAPRLNKWSIAHLKACDTWLNA
jgi:hypothetical protein